MKPHFLNVSCLADQPLRFAYGISAGHGKNGNRLLEQLGAIFEQEYLIRQGKLAILDKKRGTIPLDFGNFSVADLKEAAIVFMSLSETFKKQGHGHKPSARLFKKIALLCYSSMHAQAGLGLA